MAEGLVIDLFAGGGGASAGIEAALGRPVDIAINHDRLALAVHAANHPRTAHLASDIWETRPLEATRGRPVRLIWASPDCTHHSIAKGGQPRRADIRSLADAIIPWLRDTRADVLCCENVKEFVTWGPLDDDGKPIKARRGEDFARWTSEIRALGYRLEHTVLDASHYGAPTRRRRFFLIARRDGLPIAWPRPTHGPGLLPFHTAAECIDWNRPSPSIFERKHPLVEKTHWRLAQGIRRQVLSNPRPFILKVNHGRWEPRHEDVDAPLTTVTAKQRGHALVVPTLQHSGNGERKGQRARVLQLELPLTTVMAKGQKHALVTPWLVRYFGDPNRTEGGGRVISEAVDKPLPTVTVRDHHGYAAVALAKFRGTHENQPGSAPVDAPLPTISSGGGRGGVHVAEVRAFLARYLGDASPKELLGIVYIDDEPWQIVDIGFRMLEPDELLRAQFGTFAADYDLRLATTKKDQLRLIGNSVCPEVAEALIRANLPQAKSEAA